MIGTQIKYFRKKNNMTQQKLAYILNVQKGTISMWELNKRTPDISTIIKIADAFKIDLADLVGVDKSPPKQTYTTTQENCIKMIGTLTGMQLEKAEAYLTALIDVQEQGPKKQ